MKFERAGILLAVVALLSAACTGDRPAAQPAGSTTAAAPVVTTTPPPSPSAAASPRPRTGTMTATQACQQVVEGAVDWIELVSRLGEDPELATFTAVEVRTLTAKIQETLPYLPDAAAGPARKLVPPLVDLLEVIETGDNRTIALGEARDAVVEVMQGCPGARLDNYDGPQ